LDYRLNPEHPPLIKALAMLPVLFLNPTFPTQSDAWQKEINGQWDMGARFLYGSGNNADAIIQTARIFPMIFMILVVVLIYFFARRLMGPWWALLPAFLFAFDPTALAHGHYVTTDVGAAFVVIFAVFYFLKFFDQPTRKGLIYAGIAFGVAQVTKFSTPLLVPLFIFLALVMWVRDMATQWNRVAQRFKTFSLKLWRYVWRVAAIVIIGYVIIVYPIYFLFTAHYPIGNQVNDTTTTLASFSTGPTPAGQFCHGIRCLADLDIWMSKSPVLRPYAQYMLGILMVIQRADGGSTIYFLGQVRGSGGWTYFPVLFLLKEPIPTLIIVLLALLLALYWMIKKAVVARFRIKKYIIDYLGVNFTEFSLASFIVLYWGYSMRSPLNIGIRHIIPTLPFIYILAAGVWKKWVTRINFSAMGTSLQAMMAGAGVLVRSFIFSSAKYVLLLILLFWLLLETLFVAPYFLSYFNEFAGGTMNGYRYVTDSNYDWGQDLVRLQTFVNEHPEIDTIAVDYFGGGDPKYYLGDKEVNWGSSKGNPADQGIHWIAISVNQLQGAIEPLAPGQNRNPQDDYSWLVQLRPPSSSTGLWPFAGMGNVPPPDFRVGTSLFVYHL
jgi:hypothetical protein